jgi:hypothetical protein
VCVVTGPFAEFRGQEIGFVQTAVDVLTQQPKRVGHRGL